jgi:hypothetical protein
MLKSTQAYPSQSLQTLTPGKLPCLQLKVLALQELREAPFVGLSRQRDGEGQGPLGPIAFRTSGVVARDETGS